MLSTAAQDAFTAELHAAYDREASLARELGKVKAENAELQTKLQKLSQSLKTAKVTAREALIDMADQNAKLVQAFVDKKRECKQLKATAREDRRLWQQRLQTMELELQSNKQHIQQLMQQLHALAAKQVADAQPDFDAVLPSARRQRSPSKRLNSRLTADTEGPSTSSTASTSSTSSMLAESNLRPEQQDEVSSQGTQQQQGPAPLSDATNRVHSSHPWQREASSMLHAFSPAGSLKGLAGSSVSAAGAENSPAGTIVQQHCHASQATARLQPRQEQLLQEQGLQQQAASQLLDVQQQFEELQQRAKLLEAENVQLRSAQAQATAQIDTLRLMQQAEQLKQQGNRSFQAQQYQQAAAAYSEALALGINDASLTAVLLCNRAAAQHAAGQFLDAIADCCLAHQLDPTNPRALQRRAEAYLAVQHFSAAVSDLQQLMQQPEPNKDVAARLASAHAKQKMHAGVGPNHYLILGLEAGASVADVKAAYKRLALKHHPDKATGPEAKAAAECVFVLITAANSVLSDPSKRVAYDAAYGRSSILGGRVATTYYSRSRSSSSSSHGSGANHYAWQPAASTGFTAPVSQAAATAARAATSTTAAKAAAAAAAAAAATASRQQAHHWQPAAFRSAAPADSCTSGNSSSSCMSGTSFGSRQASSMRL